MITKPKPIVIIPDDESTWPSGLLNCLNKHYDILHLWESARETTKRIPISNEQVRQYDEAHRELGEALLPFYLRGYHCTKLTTSEISNIISGGMKLQSLSSLEKRIDNLVAQNLISSDIARELKTDNQAGEDNRAGMLWFCFFSTKKSWRIWNRKIFPLVGWRSTL